MRNDVVVEKMIQLIEKIERYCTNISYEEFAENEVLVEACIFNISQLGELTRKIDEQFEDKHPQIPWRKLYGLRNRIVHDYEGVNLRLVWEIIESDISELKEQLKKI